MKMDEKDSARTDPKEIALRRRLAAHQCGLRVVVVFGGLFLLLSLIWNDSSVYMTPVQTMIFPLALILLYVIGRAAYLAVKKETDEG